ncbi:E3 SUMO-protein ligase PIAS2 isoform X3 [Mixophyes fleayi]|uniref:E3 SUMO-protein ligase PIAS2 isoform X3 n=1 Tax=Mixophyes fleayi TaxID=3061075 RepID=UPI003F4DDB0B
MADPEQLRNMVSSFRVSELQVLLGFAGRNKSGRKHDLVARALHLLKNGCSPAVQNKIKDLYRRRFPRSLEDALGSSSVNLDSISPVDSDLAVAGIHSLPSTSVAPNSPASPSSTAIQITKPHFVSQPCSPSVPPVHPDVHLQSLPFYDVLDVLIKPTSLAQKTGNMVQERYFIFALTPQQVREICISRDYMPGGRKDYSVQVQMRMCLTETSCPQEDSYPSDLGIKINGKLFVLPGSCKPPKNGFDQKRPHGPMNITSLVRLCTSVPNQVYISWASDAGKNYSVSVYLVRQLTSAALLQKLKMKGIRNADHSRALIKEKMTADPDSEIATTSLRVSLMCPLGKMRLTFPCRAVTCTHLQCFDAVLYLQMNEKKPTWICPVCDKKAGYEILILDGLFMEILNQCSDADEIQFQEDGSWCPMRPNKKILTSPSSQHPAIEGSPVIGEVYSVKTPTGKSKKAEVIDLTVESTSEEEDEPPSKKDFLLLANSLLNQERILTHKPSTEKRGKMGGAEERPSFLDNSIPFPSLPNFNPTKELSGNFFRSRERTANRYSRHNYKAGLDRTSGDSQQYYPPMFLGSHNSARQTRTIPLHGDEVMSRFLEYCANRKSPSIKFTQRQKHLQGTRHLKMLP